VRVLAFVTTPTESDNDVAVIACAVAVVVSNTTRVVSVAIAVIVFVGALTAVESNGVVFVFCVNVVDVTNLSVSAVFGRATVWRDSSTLVVVSVPSERLPVNRLS